MPQTTRQIFIQLTSAGTDSGPFDITDSFSNVLDTSVPSSNLLSPAGRTYSVLLASTYIKVQSTGICSNYLNIDIPAIIPTTTTTTSTTTTTTTVLCEEWYNDSGSTLNGISYTDCAGTPHTSVTITPGGSICIQPGTGAGGDFGFLIFLQYC